MRVTPIYRDGDFIRGYTENIEAVIPGYSGADGTHCICISFMSSQGRRRYISIDKSGVDHLRKEFTKHHKFLAADIEGDYNE